MTTRVPDGTSLDEVNDVRAREAAHARELAAREACFGCGAHRFGRANGAR
ncbi:hypothetical protein I547_2096 [Mycobacterium kansasii 824]|nr:hypothetical protein I547_2096 [Mycobacterium kansasii 824]